MLLASVEELRIMFGFDAMADITAAMNGALHSATPYLESKLNTYFTRDTSTDMFYLHTSGYTQGSYNETVLRLRNGFVSDIVSVTGGSDSRSVAAGDGVDLLAAYTLDSGKGILTDYSNSYSRSYVGVKYTSGFPVDLVDSTSYKLSEVPAWLQEAAKLYAQLQLNNHPSFEETNVDQDINTIQDQLSVLLSQHKRYAPTALLPI